MCSSVSAPMGIPAGSVICTCIIPPCKVNLAFGEGMDHHVHGPALVSGVCLPALSAQVRLTNGITGEKIPGGTVKGDTPNIEHEFVIGDAQGHFCILLHEEDGYSAPVDLLDDLGTKLGPLSYNALPIYTATHLIGVRRTR